MIGTQLANDKYALPLILVIKVYTYMYVTTILGICMIRLWGGRLGGSGYMNGLKGLPPNEPI